LGSARIKIIQFKNSRGRLELFSRAITQTPLGTIEEGKINDPGPLTEELKQLKQKYSWHSNRVNLCLGSQAFFMRRVQLPPMTEAEKTRAMQFEVERHFPLKAREAVFDYCPVENSKIPSPSAREYLLAAASKETADSYSAVVESAGFNLQSIEILPLSLLRSILNRVTAGRGQPAKKNASCCVLLDLGFKDSSLLIARGREYQIYRSLKTGIDHFCRDAVKGDCTDYQSAHRKVYTKGSLDERGLTKTADQLAAKIIQSLNYWTEQSSLSGSEVHSLEICGGGAFIPGLAAYLEQKLSIKPRLYNPLSTFTGTSLSGQPETYREEAFFPAAQGLALRGWVK